ncbi:arylsulfatase [Christiangramia fulva]|uniref:Arylsulfatase n=1 Tax=Christiangramia fulva TaxID=2126553 RepID=A0A2R3Z5W4_9FLAO|nr:sulfatase-like hydrolase/transferase [Christiangramia fulva]AVR45604.1 arylsulfatase [Christiangramia fulva]
MIRSYRISFLGSVVLFLLFILTTQCCQNNAKEEVPVREKIQRPNILLIIADDAGWNDMSFHGSEIKTPNIDKLAKNGIQLSRFYVSPTCSPSRATLLTGIPASRLGIVAPISGKSEKSLPDSIVTLPQALKSAGYKTALLGKWHLGLKPQSGPSAYGFDYSYGFLHGQIDQYAHTYKNGDSSWHRNGKFITELGHATDLITKEAIRYIDEEKQSSKPFFLQLAYSAPHIPLQEPKKWREMYEGVFKATSRQHYAAAMTHLDSAIGEVLHKLEKEGLGENTVVIFMSDNGAQENWYPTWQYKGKYGPNPVLGSNLPLRDFKKLNYEGGIRVPAIIAWKDHFDPGYLSNYISVEDLMPTLLKIASAKEIPAGVEGRSFLGMLTEKDTSNHPIYVRGHLQESYIAKPWKLIRTRHLERPTEFELYNIEKDPSEKNDLLKEKSKIAQKMKRALQEQFNMDSDSVNVSIKN